MSEVSKADTTAERLLEVIRVLCTSDAVSDTIWLTTGVTAVEELAAIAFDHGATDEQIERACHGQPQQQEAEAGQ